LYVLKCQTESGQAYDAQWLCPTFQRNGWCDFIESACSIRCQECPLSPTTVEPTFSPTTNRPPSVSPTMKVTTTAPTPIDVTTLSPVESTTGTSPSIAPTTRHAGAKEACSKPCFENTQGPCRLLFDICIPYDQVTGTCTNPSAYDCNALSTAAPTPIPTAAPIQSPSTSPSKACVDRTETTSCQTLFKEGFCFESDIYYLCQKTCSGGTCQDLASSPTQQPTAAECSSSIESPSYIKKGEFKKATHTLFASYSAPTAYDGKVSLILIAKNMATGSGNGILAQVVTNVTGLPTSGNNVKVYFKLLSKVRSGNYSFSIIMKPDGGKWADRFRPCNVVPKALQVIIQKVDFADDMASPLIITKPQGGGVKFELKLKYYALQSVKFAIKLSCLKNPSERIGEFAKCDGTPRFVSASGLDMFGRDFENLAEEDYDPNSASPAEITIFGKLFASTPNTDFTLYVSMGSHVEDKWTGVIDKTQQISVSVVEP